MWKIKGSQADLKKNTETDIQEMTNAFVKEIDEKYAVKEKEIMTV